MNYRDPRIPTKQPVFQWNVMSGFNVSVAQNVSCLCGTLGSVLFPPCELWWAPTHQIPISPNALWPCARIKKGLWSLICLVGDVLRIFSMGFITMNKTDSFGGYVFFKLLQTSNKQIQVVVNFNPLKLEGTCFPLLGGSSRLVSVLNHYG